MPTLRPARASPPPNAGARLARSDRPRRFDGLSAYLPFEATICCSCAALGAVASGGAQGRDTSCAGRVVSPGIAIMSFERFRSGNRGRRCRFP